MSFSKLDVVMKKAEQARAEELQLRPAPPWNDKERLQANVDKRVASAYKDFWAFDKTYFPASMYPTGRAAPSLFHK
jgi:hypothetical protein